MSIAKTLVLLLLYLLVNPPPPAYTADLYSLIYKGCANKSFGNGVTDGGSASEQTLSALSSGLIAQSGSSKFYKTTSSSSSGQHIFGLFQCRGDLRNSDCDACVRHLLPMWSSLCGSAVAARVQLTGCYALYQVSGFPAVSGTQMLFRRCGSSDGSGSGFQEKRDTAFANLESGMANVSSSFYATSYQSVYAMAQCEGDLSASDCRDCISHAIQKSEGECGEASSGQIYLDKCYITYNYYPNGVPHDTSASGFGGGQTGKTVAIVVGGAAGVGFLVILLLFTRNLMKKKEDY